MNINNIVENMKRLDDVTKQVKILNEKFDRIDTSAIMPCSIKKDIVYKYLIDMLEKKIGESNDQKKEDRNYSERFFLFECRDYLFTELINDEN